MFQNLEWMNLDTPSGHRKTSVGATVDETVAADVEKVNFNGAAGVPTGPRVSMTSHSLPNVDPEVRKAPHIFIPSTSVPAAVHTVQHLHRFLSHTEPDRVEVDGFGYYVTFPNDDEGRRRMNTCVLSRNRQIFFGMYTIQMEVFENGRPSYASTNMVPSAITGQQATAGEPLPQDPADQETASVINVALQDPARLMASRKSSPCRPGSRHDPDNASVISGRTISSDNSASARNKCHVCKAVFAPTDVVAKCSSCPRRYHRRCHKPTPAAARDLLGSSSWQCKRCVRLDVPLPRKNVGPEDKIANAKAETATTLFNGPAAGTLKPLELINSSHAGHGGIIDRLAPTENNDRNHNRLHTPSTTYQQIAISPDAHQAAPAQTPATSMVPEFMAHDDGADALVEKISDAQQTSEDHTPKTGKPKLIRKRLADPQGASEDGGTTLFAASEMQSAQALNDHRDDVDWEVPETPRAASEAAKRRAQDVADGHFSFNVVAGARSSKPNGSASPVDSVMQNGKSAAEATISKAMAKKSKTHRLSCSKCGRAKKKLPTGVTSFICLECKNAISTHEEDSMSAAVLAQASRPEDPNSKPAVSIEAVSGAFAHAPVPEAAGKISDEDISDTSAHNDLDFWSPATKRHSTPQGAERGTSLQVERDDAGSIAEPGQASSSVFIPTVGKVTTAGDASSDDLSEPPDTSVRPSEPPQSPRPGTSEGVTGKRIRRGKAEFTSSSNLLLRPGLTYRTLCCLAMCEADRYRLQAKGVCQWIADNIPGYVLGEDEWELRIPMILSHYDVKGHGKHTWTKQELKPGDKGAIGPGAWYVLKPDIVQSHPRWDPMLKRAVSPPRSARTAKALVSDDSEEDELVKPSRAGKRALAYRRNKSAIATKSTLTARLQRHQSAADATDTTTSAAIPAKGRMQVDGSPHCLMQDAPTAQMTPAAKQDELSSADTPLANLRRRSGRSKVTVSPKPALISSRTSLEGMPPTSRSGSLSRDKLATETQVRQNDVFTNGREDTSHPVRRSGKLGLRTMARMNLKSQPAAPATERFNMPIRQSGRILSADLEDRLADAVRAVGQDVEYSALSLFDQWPEYHPHCDPGEEAKMLKIRERPNRKQMFGKPALYWRLGGSEQVGARSSQALSTPEPLNKSLAARKPQYGAVQALPDDEEHECGSLEDFFQLPDNPIPAIRNHTFVFREGPKADGRPKRATVWYPAGCD